MNTGTDHHWEPTRQAGLARLENFLSTSAAEYAAKRNDAHPRGAHDNVSRLSPYLRYRLITEQELIAQVLQALGAQHGGVFIDEVLWRCYWKGFLRLRPSIYQNYLRDLALLDRSELHRFNQPTGIRCFDDWRQELVETGYLHNHARMWWASIWVFTLGLPWQLGAEFFAQHLLDADPASNTLSWRWVAGLHTPGKIYQASEHNINTYTGGRYKSTPGLAAKPTAPSYQRQAIEPDPLRTWSEPLHPPHHSGGLLVMPHDLHPESQWTSPPGAIALWDPLACDATGPAAQFREGAVKDTHHRLTQWADDVTRVRTKDELVHWAQSQSMDHIQLSTPPVAQAHSTIPPLAALLSAHKIRLHLCTRPWDRLTWSFADRGFFHFKKKNKASLLGLATSGSQVSS